MSQEQYGHLFQQPSLKGPFLNFFKKTFELGIPPSGKIHTFNLYQVYLLILMNAITIPDFTSINNY